jgi:hypothetical protein
MGPYLVTPAARYNILFVIIFTVLLHSLSHRVIISSVLIAIPLPHFRNFSLEGTNKQLLLQKLIFAESPEASLSCPKDTDNDT